MTGDGDGFEAVRHSFPLNALHSCICDREGTRRALQRVQGKMHGLPSDDRGGASRPDGVYVWNIRTDVYRSPFFTAS